MLTTQQIKERCWEKIYLSAPIVECACGCGTKMKDKDHYGRNVIYINGHNGRKYSDPIQYKREWNHRNRVARQKYKTIYYRQVKIELILHKGGKCTKCFIEYDGTNGAVFQFHHRDPSQKLFGLGNKITNFSREKILAEIDKCDLLCANCHAKLHSAF
ncbi:MAG: hypothetical protein WC441_05170 [Patescibacteria group bacterium]